MKNRLEENLTGERIDEMDRYGRSSIYPKIQELLRPKRRQTLDLVNHGLAMVDDALDSNINPLEYLGHIQRIFQQSYSGKEVKATTHEEQAIIDLGCTLNRLSSAGFPHFIDRAIGKHTYAEVVNYWEIEAKNLQRRGNILDKKTLDEITLDIGSLVASQFLFILDPPSNPYEFIPLAKACGLAVKLADNLCDFREDIQKGFVNIPQEEIHHVQGIRIEGNRITQVDPNRLSLSMEYMEKEYERVQKMFESADNLLLKTRLCRPIWGKKLQGRLSLLGQFCRTWFDQAKEFMTIETLRQEDIGLHPEINFLSSDRLREIEQKYGTHLRDIISASYKQEARNTRVVKQSDPNYNPYYHKKTSEANERIRDLIQKHPEVQEVLDLGCDNGERTVELFDGKRLYGIELVKTVVDESRKKGINVYQGSMVNDVYTDNANPGGKKFDLVSIVGEMVNFMGLETDVLLERAVEQVKDEGYLLVTSMHPQFEESHDGEYVIWSHTNSTQGKWLLDEAKIPRTFLVLSKQRLQRKLDKVAQQLRCKLSLQDNSIVSNYYENMSLAMYLFRKEK